MISKKNPSIAVLILNYNQWKMTEECIQSVLKSNYQNYKIFLLDNGSHSSEEYKKLKTLKSEKCSVIRIEKNIGYVGGMNYAMRLASTQGFELFLIMNNDAIIAYDAMSELVICSQKYDYKCITTGKVYHYDRPDVIQHIGSKFVNRKYLKLQRIVTNEKDQDQWDREMEMDMIDDIFWLLPNEIYRQIGGYSPYFWFNAEQADLALRAVKAGNKLIYTPKAKLWHKGSLSIGGRQDNPKLTFYNAYSTLLLSYFHIHRYRLLIVLTSAGFRNIKSFLKGVLRFLNGKPSKFKQAYAEYMGIVSFIRWMIIKNENTGKTPFDK